MATHWSKPSSASTARTATTSATSAATSDSSPVRDRQLWTPSPPTTVTGDDDHDHTHPPGDDLDDWFDRFRSDPDFSGVVTDQCPDRATLAAAYDVPIYSADGSSRPFGSLYDPEFATHPRQLVLFVRHFYCGACQAYLQAIAEAIPMHDYFSIRVPTSIIVIGCGKPDLIPQYKKFSNCPFPIFADPTRTLYKKLGMVISGNIGSKRPEYMKDISAAAWAAGQVTTIRGSLKEADGIRKRDIFRGGNPMQIGGEFLFEEGEVVWCHRMKNYRNHAEVGTLRKLLELDE